MQLNTSDIFNSFKESGILTEHRGQPVQISQITSVESAGSTSLVFVDAEKYISAIETGKPACIVTSAEIAGKLSGTYTVLVAPNVSLAQAFIRQKYADRNFRDTEQWGIVHPSAVIHPSAKLDPSVIVGPCSVVGRGTRIGKNTVIMANTVIEEDVQIGEDCILYSGVYVGFGCILKNRVMIQPGSVIGSEGYGFAQDKQRKSHRIPQMGIVILEDDVRVGANNCIDRAAYGATRVGRGTKFDNVCHVAHNVQIGEDCLLTAGLVVAGSTKIGNRVIASGMSGLLDHLEVADDVILVHRAGVTESIKEPGVYAGLPATPMAQYMKNLVVSRKITDMKKDLSDLKKKVAALEKGPA